MRKLNAVVVEDVSDSPVLLQTLIKTYCREVNIVAVAENVRDAVKVIGQAEPQVVFCNTDLPDGNCFEILDQFTPLAFKVIFISGNPDHAYKAIKYHPVDFILKPVRINELVYAVNAITSSTLADKHRSRTGNIHPEASYPDKITLADAPGYVVMETSEMIMLEAQGNYTDVYIRGNRQMTFCKLLREFADLLGGHPAFIRTHRSFLVNKEHVKACSRGIIQLTDDRTAQLGQSYRKEFMDCFRNA